MGKMRKRSLFTHYSGYVKDDGQWRKLIGRYKTVEQARDAGATKCKPRYNRV